MSFETGVPVVETSMVAFTGRACDVAVRGEANKETTTRPDKIEKLFRTLLFFDEGMVRFSPDTALKTSARV
jgi:hypothetical protein